MSPSADVRALLVFGAFASAIGGGIVLRNASDETQEAYLMDSVSLLVLATLIGLLPAWIASRKGHSFAGFWIFGALLFIVALPVSLLIKPNQDMLQQCPSCTTWIPKAASVCSKCGRDVRPGASAPTPLGPAAGWYPAPEGSGTRYWDGTRWTEHTQP